MRCVFEIVPPRLFVLRFGLDRGHTRLRCPICLHLLHTNCLYRHSSLICPRQPHAVQSRLTLSVSRAARSRFAFSLCCRECCFVFKVYKVAGISPLDSCSTNVAYRSAASSPHANRTAPEYVKLSSANSLCLMTSLFTPHTNWSRRFSSNFFPNAQVFW